MMDWAQHQINFTPNSIPAYLQADEYLLGSDGAGRDLGIPPPSAEGLARVRHAPWNDDGRYVCHALHYFRSGWLHCPSCDLRVEFIGEQRDYYKSRFVDQVDDQLRLCGLWRMLDDTNPNNQPRYFNQERHARLEHSKAVESVNKNLLKSRQHQRQWMKAGLRFSMAQRGNDLL